MGPFRVKPGKQIAIGGGRNCAHRFIFPIARARGRGLQGSFPICVPHHFVRQMRHKVPSKAQYAPV